MKLAGYWTLDIGHSNIQCLKSDIRCVKLAGYSNCTVHFFEGTLGIFILGVVFEITIKKRKTPESVSELLILLIQSSPKIRAWFIFSNCMVHFFRWGTRDIYIGCCFWNNNWNRETPANIYQNYQYCWFSRSPRYGHGSHLRNARFIFRRDTRDIYIGCCFLNNNWNKENTSNYTSELSILLIQSFPTIRTWFTSPNCTVHFSKGHSGYLYWVLFLK